LHLLGRRRGEEGPLTLRRVAIDPSEDQGNVRALSEAIPYQIGDGMGLSASGGRPRSPSAPWW
jgi:hypothetical protein